MALAVAQDPSESFALCAPPPPSWDPYTGRPVLTGSFKARAAVHRDRDWHRSVHVWVVDRDASAAVWRVLLQLRAADKDTFPGMWDISAAGHITGSDERCSGRQSLVLAGPGADSSSS